MLTTSKMKKTLLGGLVAGLLFAPGLYADHLNTGIYVNGVEMTPQQVMLLQQSAGVSLPPGQYLVQNGCVAHLESGQTHCAQVPQGYGYSYGGPEYGYGNSGYGNGGYSYGGGVGSGYGYSNGNDGTWFHRGSDYSGGYSVGSDGSGCIYTPDWSNC